MKENLHNIFNSGQCPSADDLKQYLRASLSAEDANAIEQHLAGCELCSDAIEGLEAFSDADKLQTVTTDLNKKVDELMEEEKSKMLVPAWYKIAAAVAILFLAGGILFVNNQFSKNEKIFSEHYEAFEQKEESVITERQADADGIVETEEFAPSTSPQVEPKTKSKAFKQSEIVEELKTLPPSLDKDINAIEDAELEEQPYTAVAEEELDAIAEPLMTNDELQNRDGNNLDVELAGSVAANEMKEAESEVNKAYSPAKDDASFNNQAVKAPEQASKNQVLEVSELKKESSRNKKDKVSTGAAALKVGKNYSQELEQEYFTNGEKAYSIKDFKQAKLWFDKVLQINSKHYHSLFFNALCDLELDNTNEAISALTELSSQENGVLYDATLWYLALAHIKNDNSRKAKKILGNLIKIEGEFKSRAEELHEKL